MQYPDSLGKKKTQIHGFGTSGEWRHPLGTNHLDSSYVAILMGPQLTFDGPFEEDIRSSWPVDSAAINLQYFMKGVVLEPLTRSTRDL